MFFLLTNRFGVALRGFPLQDYREHGFAVAYIKADSAMELRHSGAFDSPEVFQYVCTCSYNNK